MFHFIFFEGINGTIFMVRITKPGKKLHDLPKTTQSVKASASKSRCLNLVTTSFVLFLYEKNSLLKIKLG